MHTSMPFTSRLSGASWTARLFVAVCGAVIVMELFWIAWILRFGTTTLNVGFSTAREQGAVVVTRVAKEGPAARALEPGDVILAVDGDVRAATIGPWFRLPGMAQGKPYRMTVERGGSAREVLLQARLSPRPPRELAYRLFLVLAGLSFAATALFLSFQRWEDPLARHGAFACLLPSLTLAGSGLAIALPFLPAAERLLVAFTWYPHPFHLAVAFAFYRRFPPGVPSTKWLDAFEKILLGTFFIVIQQANGTVNFFVPHL